MINFLGRGGNQLQLPLIWELKHSEMLRILSPKPMSEKTQNVTTSSKQSKPCLETGILEFLEDKFSNRTVIRTIGNNFKQKCVLCSRKPQHIT